MKEKYVKQLLAAIMACVLSVGMLSGCGAALKSAIPPLPAGWENEQGDENDKKQEDASDKGNGKSKDESTADESAADLSGITETSEAEVTAEAAKADDTESKEEPPLSIEVTDNYYPEVSNSGLAFKELPLVHEAVRDSEIGRDMKIWAVEKGELVSTNYERTLRPKTYSYGSTLDFVNKMELPVSTEGVNIFVTDLFSNEVTSTDFGRWVAENGEGISLYALTMEYSGGLYFRDYTDYQTVKETCIKGCEFDRTLLVVVFGKDSEVCGFDSRFKEELPESIDYEFIHFAKPADGNSGDDGIVELSAAPCFKKNISDVKYDETNISWGVTEKELMENVTWANTFAYMKSKYSASDALDKIKVVLYGDTEQPMEACGSPEIFVQKYNSKEKSWETDDQIFSLKVQTVTEPMAASEDPKVNSKLGGDMIPSVDEGGAIVLSLEAEDLDKGMFGVEVVQTVREVNPQADAGSETDPEEQVEKFIENNSVGYSDYWSALEAECKLTEQPNNQSIYEYIGDDGNESAFAKLLDLKGFVGELTKAGASVAEQKVCFRVLIKI